MIRDLQILKISGEATEEEFRCALANEISKKKIEKDKVNKYEITNIETHKNKKKIIKMGQKIEHMQKSKGQ